MRGRPCRVAMYSPGMVGFGHIRRNASIAQALRCSALRPVLMMIAEAWQAGALPMPPGVDCVTLPALRKGPDGHCDARALGVSNQELVGLRTDVIASAIKAFEPDVLIVDHLPRGAADELEPTLELMRRRGDARCVLGLRDVLQDPMTVHRTWSDNGYGDAIRDNYDAVWIYGDPAVYDSVREYDVLADMADRVHYTGYLDERPRLEFASSQSDAVVRAIPRGRLALCLVGGGQDGADVAEAFVAADMAADVTGVLVTGPYMPSKLRQRLRHGAARRGRVTVLDFVAEPAPLINRAERIVAMAGYNTMCEVLSFEKHALVVPRVTNREQWIRAQRMEALGLVHVLHPDNLTPAALTEWLARDLGPPPPSHRRIDFGGLNRIPSLLVGLLGVSAPPRGLAVAVPVA